MCFPSQNPYLPSVNNKFRFQDLIKIFWLLLFLAPFGGRAEIIEQWDFTSNRLIGLNGTSMKWVTNKPGQADQTGGSKDSSLTINNDGGFSGSLLESLNISTNNDENLTFAMRINSWSFAQASNNAGKFIISLDGGTNGSTADTRTNRILTLNFGNFSNALANGTQIYLGNVWSNGPNNAVRRGGFIAGSNRGSNSVVVGCSLNLKTSAYQLWVGSTNDDGTAWYSRSNASSGFITGLSNVVIESIQFGWQNINQTNLAGGSPAMGPDGDFVEIDHLKISTDGSLPAGVGTTVVERWDYAANSLGGINSNPMTFVSAGGNADNAALSNSYTINRSNGYSGKVMTNLAIGKANGIDLMDISMKVNAWDFTRSGGDGHWGVRLRDFASDDIAYLRFGDDTNGNTRLSLSAIWSNGVSTKLTLVGGVILSNRVGTSPITVGLRLNLKKETYQLWVGDPDSDSGAGWNRANTHTGPMPTLSNVVVDNFVWGWTQCNDTTLTSIPNGDFIELDQVQITKTIMPDPSLSFATNEWRGKVGAVLRIPRPTLNGPMSLSLPGIPEGLAMDGDGSICGIPRQVGTLGLAMVGSNAMGISTSSITFNIAPGTPRIESLPARVNLTYGQPLSAEVLDGGTAVVDASGETLLGAFTFMTDGATVFPSGTNPVQVLFTPSDTNNYEPVLSSNTVSVVVAKATPSITWSNPAAITSGTPLSGTQLNATSPVAGTFTYNPPMGTVLNAGTNTLEAVFNATDENNYVSPVTNMVSLVVNAATSTPWETWNRGTNPGMTPALLNLYAVGGASSPEAKPSENLRVSMDASVLKLTAIVRTNDTNLSVTGEWGSSLGGGWTALPTNVFGLPSPDTNQVPVGCERRDFTMERGTNPKLFLRLKSVYLTP